MSRNRSALTLWGTLAVAIVVLGGCAESSNPLAIESPDFVVTGANSCSNTDLEVKVFKLVKLGGSGTFSVVVTDLDGNVIDESEVSLDEGDCADVAVVGIGYRIVTVTETSSTPASISCTATSDCHTDANSATTHIGQLKGAVVTFVNSMAPGRMTGGGFQIRVDGARVTRGLTLHCDNTLSNNLEINWPGGNNWHLERESLTSIECIDDPNFDPFPPAAPFDTFIAEAVGSLNQVDGSIIRFRFIDDGEPGRTDEAHFSIWAPGADPDTDAPVLEVSGQLDGGNLKRTSINRTPKPRDHAPRIGFPGGVVISLASLVAIVHTTSPPPVLPRRRFQPSHPLQRQTKREPARG